MFNRQNCLTLTPEHQSHRVDCQQRDLRRWIFCETYVQCTSTHTHIHKHTHNRSVTQTKRTQHFPYHHMHPHLPCSLFCSFGRIDILLFQLSSLLFAFSSSFHWYKGIRWSSMSVWQSFKIKGSISCATNSTTDPKKRETIKYEEVTLSSWTESWHKRIGVSFLLLEQPFLMLLVVVDDGGAIVV